MGVVSVVISCMDDLDICPGNFGLFGEFLADEIFGYFQIAVEQPAYQAYCKHIAAFQHGLVVHSGVGKAVFHHLRDRGGDDILPDAHFLNRVVGLESRLLQVRLLESVCIDDDTSGGFGKLILGFQCGGVHRYQYVAFVARGIDFLCTDMHLEA